MCLINNSVNYCWLRTWISVVELLPSPLIWIFSLCLKNLVCFFIKRVVAILMYNLSPPNPLLNILLKCVAPWKSNFFNIIANFNCHWRKIYFPRGRKTDQYKFAVWGVYLLPVLVLKTVVKSCLLYKAHNFSYYFTCSILCGLLEATLLNM